MPFNHGPKSNDTVGWDMIVIGYARVTRLIRTSPSIRYSRRLLAEFEVGCEQVGCDHRTRAGLRRTLRLAQNIAAFIGFKSPQLFCSKDRACDVVFSANWASNAQAVNCGHDVLCIGAADGTVHVLTPLVAIESDLSVLQRRPGTFIETVARSDAHSHQ